jgi:Asp-tRNA(Asn)/Glu-tRNA(Gln) amidotransferase A subunit family amidase
MVATMTVAMTCLVADDHNEIEIRRLYGAWAVAASEVVRDLASATNSPAQWPKAPDIELGPAPTPVIDTIGQSAIIRARLEGWLLTAGAPVSDAPTTEVSPPHLQSLRNVGVAVKDVIDVSGLPTGNGVPDGTARTPARSASAWSTLEAAGATCIGKAATHEMAWGVTTPSIRNPHDRDRIAGGSSGGSAATVASGAAIAGLGTDTGGSIRIPAALCGVVGVRPTFGSISTAGVTPLAPEQDVVGPLASTVDMAAALLEVLLKRHTWPMSTDVTGMRVGVLTHVGALERAVSNSYHTLLQDLGRAGACLIPLDTKVLRLANSVSLATMLTSSARLYADAVRADPTAYGAATRALMTLGQSLVPRDQLEDARRSLQAMTSQLFTTHQLDAVVTPTSPCVAPRRGAQRVRIEDRVEHVDAVLTRFTAWASATGMPAVSAPTEREGLPTSVQFLAPPYHEAICLKLAKFTELHRTQSK